MTNQFVKANDVIDSLAEGLKKSDVITAKLLSKISISITQKRLELEMNQKEFADFMGVTQGMVSRWENGNCNFTIETLVQICEKLNLSLNIKMSDEQNAYCNSFNVSNVKGYTDKFLGLKPQFASGEYWKGVA